jgi:ribonuclease HIII
MASIKLTPNQKNAIIESFKDYSLECTSEYLIFKAKTREYELSIYENNKGEHFKMVIQTKKIVEFCRDFDISNDQIKEITPVKKTETGFTCLTSQIGSDEVGFGDFFGPIVVVATYVNKETLDLIYEYGINDSKKISDTKILDFVPKIISKIDYSLLLVDNIKLNELFEKGYNLTQIKSILHNRALNNIYKKHKSVKNIFIDQFTSPNSYYKYNAFEEDNIPNIHFQTHAESLYPSVALASCIARYYFLIKNKEVSEKYGVEIPFGASKKVDEFAKQFIDKFGEIELKNNVKIKFKNYQNLLNSR